MSKETAFYPRLQALTDQWMDLFGYLAPLVVTDTLEEYRAVRESAGLMDFTMLRKVDIDGPGALELVNTVVTRDVSQLTPGKIAYGALADEDGKRSSAVMPITFIPWGSSASTSASQSSSARSRSTHSS